MAQMRPLRTLGDTTSNVVSGPMADRPLLGRPTRKADTELLPPRSGLAQMFGPAIAREFVRE